jgi:hypothetical protein
MRKFKTLSVLICVLLALGGVGLYLKLTGGEKGFPAISGAGSFLGKIKVEIKELEFFVSTDQNGSGQAFAIADDDWRGEVKGNIYKISTADGLLYLYGEQQKDGGFRGTIEDSQGIKAGEWSMKAVAENNNLQSIQEVQSLNQLLNLSSALQEIESKIKAQQSTITQQKVEVERLSEYLTEGQALRSNADKKFKEKKDELNSLVEIKSNKLREAEQLREKFDISQRLFGTGKLVYLSRSTLDLEKRWFNSMYTSSGVDNDTDFENLVARAERIMLLKNEISFELNRYGTVNE